ncbi:hypothetical protein [Athalassotoga saccharophila]|uniref:hypothetical protein n=1 Tax=Athalassotoga saccharophila TaxID=1441386 RepID=UPI001379AB8C|nr:hypothetical protein [Athalassotoga saccharophila]BBJ27836.1 hypothetical protein ATHSA_0728 [Athalassotoga saccharophila]
MERAKKIDFSFNIFLTYLFFLPIFSVLGWRVIAGFSLGFLFSEIGWILLNEDVEKFKNGKRGSILTGFLKRYLIFSILLLMSFLIISVEGFFSAFLGLEILSLTLFVSPDLIGDKGG